MVDTTTDVAGAGGGGNAGSAFSDKYFYIYNEGDPTKWIEFDASTLVTGSIFRMTLPGAFGTGTGTLALKEVDNQFSAIQTIDSGASGVGSLVLTSRSLSLNVITINDIVGGGFQNWLTVPAGGLLADNMQRIPNASGTFVVTGDAGSDPPSGSNFLYLGSVNRTVQGADIASVNLTNAAVAGQYLIVGELQCTTSAGGAGTVTVTFSWTNDSGARTSAVSKILTSVGTTAILIPTYLASGNVTWAVTHSGSYSTSKYALRVRILSLG